MTYISSRLYIAHVRGAVSYRTQYYWIICYPYSESYLLAGWGMMVGIIWRKACPDYSVIVYGVSQDMTRTHAVPTLAANPASVLGSSTAARITEPVMLELPRSPLCCDEHRNLIVI